MISCERRSDQERGLHGGPVGSDSLSHCQPTASIIQRLISIVAANGASAGGTDKLEVEGKSGISVYVI